MNAQNPAYGISQTYDSNKSKCYRVECECTSDDHALLAWVEAEPDDDSVNLTFYVNTHTPLVSGFFSRISGAAKFLFTGMLTQQHEMILRKQTAVNFTEALRSATIELKKV